MNEINDWIQKNPEINREKLCQKFEDHDNLAYEFALGHSEYKDFVKHFITESDSAYLWAHNIGDQEFMKHKISESSNAYFWARDIGNQDFMKQIVETNGEQQWIDQWNMTFEDNQIN